MKKERLDILLVQKGLFPSREKAKSSIMAGIVYIDGIQEDKPGTQFEESCTIEVRENINPFVSRGGLKLDKAMKQFGIRLQETICMDVGASTGGFTDCMLKNGATKVFAVDVGYGQLDWKLRNDPRVVNMERTNIRYVKPEEIGTAVDFASVDVSFISLKKVLPVLKELLGTAGEVLCLIKPQFEAGRDKVGKHGVVRDKNVHTAVIEEIILFSLGLDFRVKGLTYSPIKGPEGNIEYLLYLSKTEGESGIEELKAKAAAIASESHTELAGL